jgi:hypothetical protein
MWLYVVGFVLIVAGLLGTFLGGGVFTIALLVVGLIILGSAVGYGIFTRAKAGNLGLETDAHPSVNQPLPREHRGPSAHAPTSPEALADARRAEQ